MQFHCQTVRQRRQYSTILVKDVSMAIYATTHCRSRCVVRWVIWLFIRHSINCYVVNTFPLFICILVCVCVCVCVRACVCAYMHACACAYLQIYLFLPLLSFIYISCLEIHVTAYYVIGISGFFFFQKSLFVFQKGKLDLYQVLLFVFEYLYIYI